MMPTLRAEPVLTGLKSASKIGSRTNFSAACTRRSLAVGTVASYCGPFSRLCCLGFDVVGEFVGAGDASAAVGLDLVAVGIQRRPLLPRRVGR